MNREEWDKAEEAQKRYREDCGIFTEWPSPSDVAEGRRDAPAAGETRARRAPKDKPKAL